MASTSNACSTKWPPLLESDEQYEVWKNDVNIWCKLTDLQPTKQALAIHLSLKGRARSASSEVDVADLEKDTGVKTLLDKLDELFLPDAGRRQFTAFQSLYILRRQGEASVLDFICDFANNTYNKLL